MRGVARPIRRVFRACRPLTLFAALCMTVCAASVVGVLGFRVVAPAPHLRGADWAACAPCAGLRARHGNSAESDVILAGVFGGEKRVRPFLRTLRASGSLASVVFVTDRTVPESIAAEYAGCGARFFPMRSSPETDYFYPHSLRYVGYRQFLDSERHAFLPVFHADSDDIFFQSDPFTAGVARDELYFAMEDVTINKSDWNSGWLVRAYNESVSEALGAFTVSCSGTVIGGYDQFVRYLDTMLAHPSFWANGRHSLDQAYHNYLLHTGEFERNGVRPVLRGCNSDVLTMHYCSRGQRHSRDGRIVGPDGTTVPAVVHQYNLFAKGGQVLTRMCPAGPP